MNKNIALNTIVCFASLMASSNLYAATEVFCRGLESSLTITEDTRFNSEAGGTLVLIGLQSAAAENSRYADLFSNGARVNFKSLKDLVSKGESVNISDQLGRRKITVTFSPDTKMATVELQVNGEIRLKEKQFCKTW